MDRNNTPSPIPPPRPPSGRLLHLLAVPRWYFIPLACPAFGLVPLIEPGGIRSLVIWSLVAVYVAWHFVEGRHSKMLCVDCFRVPDPTHLPPQTLRRRFSFFHSWEMSLGASMVSLLVPPLAGAAVGLFLPGSALVYFFLALGCAAWVKLRAQRDHERFRVWCPWCDDGDDADAFTPDPDRPKIKPLA